MALLPVYEVIDGKVQFPKEDYDKWAEALVSIAVTGVLNKDHAPEVYETFESNRKYARWALGWKHRSERNNL